jgi:hypothetical protein
VTASGLNGSVALREIALQKNEDIFLAFARRRYAPFWR